MASSPDVRRDPRGSVILGALTMLAASLLLFWLPLLGPLIAGFLGGWIIKRPGPAVAVALLPAVVLGLLIGVVLAAFDLPLIGTLAGTTAFIAVAVQDIPLFIGAILGGALAD